MAILHSDLENLVRFAYCWTDHTSTGNYQFGEYSIGIINKIPIEEAKGLFNLIPWHNFCLDGRKDIPYNQLIRRIFTDADLHMEAEMKESHGCLVIRIMCLGDYIGYWKLINPYTQMSRTSKYLRMMLVDHGGLSVAL